MESSCLSRGSNQRASWAARDLSVIRLLALALGLWVSGTSILAQETSPVPNAVEQQADVPQVDVFDLVRRARGRPPAPDATETTSAMYAFAPVIGTKPSTGPFAGAAGNIAFYAGDPSTTRLSSTVIALTASTRGHVLLTGRFGMFLEDNNWYLEGDDRMNWTGQTAYDLGQSETDAGVFMRYDWARIHQDVYYEVLPAIYVGMGFEFDRYSDARADEDGTLDLTSSPYVEYSVAHGFDLVTQSSTSASLNVLFDNRDSTIRPTEGWRAKASYRAAFEGFLGGSSSWQRAAFDVRRYRDFDGRGRRVLALWLRGDIGITGYPPYFELPSTGGDPYGRSARGYAEGRYRGERLLAAELEYRTTLTANGLLGAVAFANATTVTNLLEDQHLFEFAAPGVGAGLRVLINKRSQTNICVDVGFGRDGSRALYIAVQEAF